MIYVFLFNMSLINREKPMANEMKATSCTLPQRVKNSKHCSSVILSLMRDNPGKNCPIFIRKLVAAAADQHRDPTSRSNA